MVEVHKWLLGSAATLGATAIIAGGAGIAHADEPSLFTDWSGNGRSLRLAADGSGTLSLVSAPSATNGETWSVMWEGDPGHRVSMTLASQLSQTGYGLDLTAGDPFVATLQEFSGYTVLIVDSNKVGAAAMSCTLEPGQAPRCGE